MKQLPQFSHSPLTKFTFISTPQGESFEVSGSVAHARVDAFKNTNARLDKLKEGVLSDNEIQKNEAITLLEAVKGQEWDMSQEKFTSATLGMQAALKMVGIDLRVDGALNMNGGEMQGAITQFATKYNRINPAAKLPEDGQPTPAITDALLKVLQRPEVVIAPAPTPGDSTTTVPAQTDAVLDTTVLAAASESDAITIPAVKPTTDNPEAILTVVETDEMSPEQQKAVLDYAKARIKATTSGFRQMFNKDLINVDQDFAVSPDGRTILGSPVITNSRIVFMSEDRLEKLNITPEDAVAVLNDPMVKVDLRDFLKKNNSAETIEISREEAITAAKSDLLTSVDGNLDDFKRHIENQLSGEYSLPNFAAEKNGLIFKSALFNGKTKLSSFAEGKPGDDYYRSMNRKKQVQFANELNQWFETEGVHEIKTLIEELEDSKIEKVPVIRPIEIILAEAPTNENIAEALSVGTHASEIRQWITPLLQEKGYALGTENTFEDNTGILNGYSFYSDGKITADYSNLSENLDKFDHVKTITIFDEGNWNNNALNS